MVKILEEHFKIFREECEYWLNRYQLGDYDTLILNKNNSNQKDAQAWQLSDHANKWAVLALAKNWIAENEFTDTEIRKQAYHEVNELLLDSLDTLAKERFNITVDRIDEARHGIIMRLQTAFFNQSLKERGLTCT